MAKGLMFAAFLGGNFPHEVGQFLAVALLYKPETCNHKQLKATSLYFEQSNTG